MNHKLILILCLLIIGSLAYAFEPSFARDPAVSPNGDQICFVYDGDLWLVPFKGGNARRLTSTESSEWGPAWSPDGSLIAFNSNREGQSYAYTISPETGIATPVFRESFSVSDWFKDGKSLLCTRYSAKTGTGFYRLSLDGSRPLFIGEVADRYATLSPDNSSIVFNRYGDPFREAYQGSLNGDLWTLDIATKNYTRLTTTSLTERYPRYSMSTGSLYYCLSDGDRFQLMQADQGAFDKATKLTSFPVWSARDISIARTNDRIAFELFDEIWTYDPTKLFGEKVAKLNIVIPEDRWTSTQATERLDNYFWDYTVSDDHLLLGFQSAYDVFAMPFKGGEPKRITTDHAGNDNMLFLPGGHEMLLQRMNRGRDDLFVAGVDSSAVSLIPFSWFSDKSLFIERIYRDPKDRIIIHYRDNINGGKIAIADKNLENITPLELPGAVSSNFAINADSTYAIYSVLREDIWMRELYLYDFATSTSTKILNDDQWINDLTWTPDSKSVLISRSSGLYRLDLVPRDEFETDKDNWTDVWAASRDKAPLVSITAPDTSVVDSLAVTPDTPAKPQEPAAKPKLQIVWEGLDHRLFPILTPKDYYLWVVRCVDDTTFQYISEPRGTNRGEAQTKLRQTNIYGLGDDEVFTLGKQVMNIKYIAPYLYYTDANTLRSYNIENSKRGEVTTVFDYKYDEKVLNRRVFEQVWGAFGLNFYDPEMHGRDWEAVYKQYQPYIDKARNMEDIAMIVDEMIGDVNASHTGFYPREEKIWPTRQSAYLGVEFDYSKPSTEGIIVNTVLPDSRLSRLYRMKAGARILSIDGVTITAQTPLDSLLADKQGKKIKLVFEQDGTKTDATVTGLTWTENRSLWYQYKVAKRSEQVKTLSGGRIGYIHIPAMGNVDWQNFYRDLFKDNADKEALVIDVRGNVGGRIHDDIISLLLKRPYAFSSSRRYSKDPSPEPGRMWAKPSIVLVDEHSFSDGEIFPIVYQQLKLGKVVGYPSSGAVIGTWEYELIDGSSMRMPGSGWYKLDGTNMEGTGAMPDIVVELSPNDIVADHDPQLLRAVTELMKELK